MIFCEHKALYATMRCTGRGYAIPFAEANVAREGKDVTIVGYGLTCTAPWRPRKTLRAGKASRRR